MIFFTRALQDGIQEESGWTRRACRTFARNLKIYNAYRETITPLLPRSIVQFCRHSLHDARIESMSQGSGTLTLVMDCRGTFAGRYRGHRRVQLTFLGVRRCLSTRALVGEWWLYDEVHLSSRAAFSLHVLFSSKEIEFEADDLAVEPLPARAKK
jgi:hypothetical protein